jgi:hypothetical protein
MRDVRAIALMMPWLTVTDLLIFSVVIMY